MADFKKAIKSVPGLSHEKEKIVTEAAEKKIHGYNGMNKKEFKEVIRGFEKDTKDKIERRDARSLRKLV